MSRLRSLHPLTSCVLLLLLLLFSRAILGDDRPHLVHRGTTSGRNGTQSQEFLILEAVKMGILSSLGLDREPRLEQKAPEQELRRMFQLYRETLGEMKRDSIQPTRESRQSTLSTVLFPTTVEPLKAIRKTERQPSLQHIQWFRAAFHKNPNISDGLMLAVAELKIFRKNLNQTEFGSETRKDVRVKVNGRKPFHSEPLVHRNVSHDVTLNLGPEVDEWMRTDGGPTLVVDVGAIGIGDVVNTKPLISLELSFRRREAARRTRRSDKEDDCDDEGLCCRRSVAVSFKDIGWTDWVVAPSEYTMHFCEGTCPHNYKPASMHTQVKSRLSQITRGGTPRPCCVPAAYEPMVLMHYDSTGKLKLTSFNDLIVSRCNCA